MNPLLSKFGDCSGTSNDSSGGAAGAARESWDLPSLEALLRGLCELRCGGTTSTSEKYTCRKGNFELTELAFFF